MQTTPRKEIRLPREEYVGRKIYFITICCQDRLPIFKHVVRAKIAVEALRRDRKSTRLNSSHLVISYAVFCLKKKNSPNPTACPRARNNHSMPNMSDSRRVYTTPTS